MAYSGYGRAAYTPGERKLPVAQWMENAQTCPMFLLLFHLVKPKPNLKYSGYGRAAYTPGERRLPAAQWMEDAQTCPTLIEIF